MGEKVFRDPVHGFITVEAGLLLRLIDTPEFQRLRRIRQLGAAYGTYHGADHSRFAHALGALHIMGRALERLEEQGAGTDPWDALAGRVAALLHDLGHGPFSHLWETAGGVGKHHEAWTAEAIAGDTSIGILLRQADPRLPDAVLDIFRGAHPARYLTSLVASQLDVDRMDYLLRDSLATGASYGRFDIERLLHNICLAGGRLAVSMKGLANVEEYLLARYFMYWRVYFHRAVRAQEVTLQSFWRRACHLWAEGGPAALESPASLVPWLAHGAGGPAPTLGQHLALDDCDIFYAAKLWTTSPDGILRDLAGRFLNRQLLKPVWEEPFPTDQPPDLAGVAALLVRRGYDPRYYLAVDRTADVAYDYYAHRPGGGTDPILLVSREGQVREVSEVSSLVRSLAAQPRIALHVYVPADCRPEARQCLSGAVREAAP